MNLAKPIDGTAYRADRVKRHDGKPYAVPCGMSTIVYLSGKPPSISRVLGNLPTVLADNEVVVFSKWNAKLNEYVVAQVERRQ
jgi:hypothetical protein